MESEPEQTPRPKPSYRIKTSVWVVLCAFIILIGAGVWFFVIRNPAEQPVSAPKTAQSDLQTYAGATAFPLYHPANPPSNAVYDEASLSVGRDVATYSYTVNGQPLYVTEQPLPKTIEEVVKSKEFTTPSGRAYIADLNGKKAGFLYTDKTLVIVSGNDAAAIEALLSSFTAL